MKKTLSLILALLMTLSCASAIFAADPAITDTAAAAGESVYADAIEFLVDKEIMKGYDNGELGEANPVKRYEMALFVGRILTGWTDDKTWENGPENSSKFTDLAGTGAEACYGALSYVQQKGIIEGYGNGKFGPEDQVKYQDVLTMAVRALGYQNLEYPWGYIEKAINLGITENVKGVAYTAAAKRGEVAQVVYDTLFAETTKGDTLALRVFGVEFGWETVVITATEKVCYDAALANTKAPKGTVGFKVMNADGTLAEHVYYVNAKALGLDAAGAAEIALGRPYKVFFEIDANSDLVKVNKYVELYDAENIVWNEAGNDQIAAFLKGYTLVDKYAEGFSAVLGNISSKYDATYTKKDIIVKGDLYETTYPVASAENYKYAINWVTGDILEKQTDGTYKTIWHWNDKMQTYYAIKTAEDVDGTEVVVGIDYMDEKDAAKLRADYNAWFVEFKEGYALQTIKDVAKQIGSPAYAMLETYDLNGDDTADYALYEEFRFGYMSQGTAKCNCKDNPTRTTLKVQNVNTLAEKVYEINNPDAEVESTAFEEIMTNSCATCGKVFVNAEYAPVKLLGNYKGFVVYNYNPVTGEVKIVKEIKELGSNSDEKSYITTGLVVSYDIAKGTVNVQADDGTIKTLELGYDALEGADFQYLGKGNYAAEKVYADYFYSLYNQYAKYVVVDGKLVYMTVEGAKDYTAALIVKEFAGISTDGYILVDAYNLANLKLERFRIATFDGYKQGDLFYNYKLTQAELQKMFATGTIYKIDSYVPAEKAYNVHVAGAWNETTDKYVYTDAIGTSNGTVSFGNAAWGHASFGKMSASDKYVIIGDPDGKNPIRVYQGIVTNKNWKITGDYIKTGSTYIFFNIDEANTIGFENAYKTQLVLYTGARGHVSAMAPSDEVLGAVAYNEIRVWDIATGKYIAVKAENIKLKAGYMYTVVDGVILEDTAVKAYDAANKTSAMVDALVAMYADGKDGNADVMLNARLSTETKYNATQAEMIAGSNYYTEKGAYNADSNKIYEFTWETHGTMSLNAWTGREFYPRLNNGVKVPDSYLGWDVTGSDWSYYMVETAADGTVSDLVSISMDENRAKGEYNWWVIADNWNNYRYDYVVISEYGKMLKVYIFEASKTAVEGAPANPVVGTTDVVVSTDKAGKTDWDVSDDDRIQATVDAVGTTKDGVLASVKVNSISFEYVGDCALDSHGVVAADGNYFVKGYDFHASNIRAKLGAKELHDALSFVTYDAHTGEEICELAKKVTVDISDKNVVVDADGKDVTITLDDVDTGAQYVFALNLDVVDGKLVVKFVDGVATITKKIGSATTATTFLYKDNQGSTVGGVEVAEKWLYPTLTTPNGKQWLISDEVTISENVKIRVRVLTDKPIAAAGENYNADMIAWDIITLGDPTKLDDPIVSFGTKIDSFAFKRHGTESGLSSGNYSAKDLGISYDYFAGAPTLIQTIKFAGSGVTHVMTNKPAPNGNVKNGVAYRFTSIGFSNDGGIFTLPLCVSGVLNEAKDAFTDLEVLVLTEAVAKALPDPDGDVEGFANTFSAAKAAK